jgi:hypothetical protein
MTRKQLLKSPEYWLAQMQIGVYEAVVGYMMSHGLTPSDFCEKKKLDRKVIEKVIDGDWVGTASEFCKIILACDKVPVIKIENLKEQK